MLIVKKDNYTLITMNESSVKEFHHSFVKEIESQEKKHLILDFSESFNTSIKEILLFLNIANDYRKNGISFVIICSGLNIDSIPDEINIAPTMTEALDVLEMDMIERDLMNF